ncbi:MAG: hypothetical protein LDL39_09535 [Magnetospirillum sp.]|nr:hypothetical protein [Magnetospirillum sp.]
MSWLVVEEIKGFLLGAVTVVSLAVALAAFMPGTNAEPQPPVFGQE